MRVRVSPNEWMGVALLLGVAGCGNQTARAPNPTQYRCPATLAYRVDYVSEAQRDGQPLLRYEESKVIRLTIRDDETYVLVHDSVLKTSQRPDGPLELVSYAPEDTLAWYIRLGPLGELRDMQVGCDPALPACAAVLPSVLRLELRPVIPRLWEWPVPRGASWTDTLSFDDVPRLGGTRGTVVTAYTAARDTTIGGAEYWMIAWRSIRRAFQSSNRAAIVAEPPVEETGVTFVDKQRLLPAYSAWAGAVSASPAMRELGPTATGFRGRAYLAGSSFDSQFGQRPQ